MSRFRVYLALTAGLPVALLLLLARHSGAQAETVSEPRGAGGAGSLLDVSNLPAYPELSSSTGRGGPKKHDEVAPGADAGVPVGIGSGSGGAEVR